MYRPHIFELYLVFCVINIIAVPVLLICITIFIQTVENLLTGVGTHMKILIEIYCIRNNYQEYLCVKLRYQFLSVFKPK